jgi:hypothetical protein
MLEIKLTVTHTASPELLAALGGLGKADAKPAVQAQKSPAPTNGVSHPSKAGDSKTVSITDIRQLATKLSKTEGKGEQVKQLLASFDCKSLTSLTPEQYQDFHDQLNSL